MFRDVSVLIVVLLVMESSKLRWSTEEIDLRRFIELYKKSLPAVLLTTVGYMDNDNINEVSADQVTN